MANTALHPKLEDRLAELGAHIGTLKEKLAATQGLERLERAAEIVELEQRHRLLQERLYQLNNEGEGLPQNVEAEVMMMTTDLADALDDLMLWIDASYLRAHPKP